MKRFCFAFVCCVLLAVSHAQGGAEAENNAVPSAGTTPGPVPLDVFKSESDYVFGSDLNHGGSFGKQDELQTEFEYGHRIRLTGNYYLRLGLAYERFDFGSTSAPVPNHLQAIVGVVGAEYMHGSDVGAFFQLRPGFYFENQIGISSFDVPITLGAIFVVQDKKLYLFGGTYVSFLRGEFPVLPLAGVIWILSDHVRLMGIVPDPRLIYSPNDKLDLWVGGEFVGSSFRTDRNDNIRPGKLSGAQVDFADYRAGVGLTYPFSKNFQLDAGVGYSIQRNFDFARAGETYRTDPSPYVRLQLSASF
jgi:opacity protein-like surface antigen